MSKMAPLILAAAGGITPNLLTLAGQLTVRSAELPNGTYFIGLLIFAGLGTVVALAWEEKDLKKAFYLGIGLPSLIQLNVANLGIGIPAAPHLPIPTVESSIVQHTKIAIFGVASAQASTTTRETYSLNRKLVLVPGEIANAPNYYVVFARTEPGDWAFIEEHRRVPFKADEQTELMVPDFAECAMVEVDQILGGRICWPSIRNLVRRARLDITKNVWSGLLRSFGIYRQRYEITLTPLPS